MSQLFVRKASGLVRDIGAFDAFLLSVGVIAPTVWSIVAMTTWTPLLYPGADIVQGMFIGMLPTLVFGLVYALMGAAMPRSGGDYVWISRIVHPLIGYMCSWAFTILVIVSMGLDMMYTTSVMLSIPLVTIGKQIGDAGLIAAGSAVTAPNYTFLVACIFIMTGGLIVAFGKKALSVVMRTVFFIQMLSVIVFCALLLGVTPTTFAPAFNSYTGTTVTDVLSKATAAGWSPATYSLWTTVTTMPLMIFLYNGLSYSTAGAGEIKRVG